MDYDTHARLVDAGVLADHDALHAPDPQPVRTHSYWPEPCCGEDPCICTPETEEATP